MRTILNIASFEWKILWRSKTIIMLLIVVLGAGIYASFFGKFEVEKQNDRIAYAKEYERQKFDSLLFWAKLDTTVSANKEKYEQAVSPTGAGWSLHFTYCASHKPSPAASICLGQGDLFPSYYRINMRDISRQTNVGELANPMKLLTGNFDLSYVFVFLFPLLIIGLFYNLYAFEKEGGTLLLLRSQSISINSVLFSKGVLRLLVILTLVFILLLSGFVIQEISLAKNLSLFLSLLFIVWGYCLIWVFLISGIVAMKRSSSLTAILGLGIWILFTLISPALINLFVLANEPVPNRAEMIHAIRAQNDKNWENPKSYVLDKFYEHYPEYNDGDTTDFYKWYYAGFTVLDMEAKPLKETFDKQVDRRNELIKKWEWLAPAAYVHERLSKVCKTDRDSHLLFVKQVEDYHAELKNLYYTRIFEKSVFSYQDLKELEKRLM